MKIVAFSTRRPVTVTMVVMATVIFGWVAFSRLSINLLPDVTYPTLTVRTEYEGTAPTEIERLITEPVESAVGVVTNVIRVSSTSRPGISEVVVEFAWGTDMDFASLDVRERLDRLRLPVDAEKPVLLRFDPSLDPIMRIGLYGEENLVALRLLAEEQVKPELERLEGVAAVRVNGGLEEEIQVEIDAPKLASLRITFSQLVNRLAQENVNLTGGQLKDGEAEYLVRTLNEFQSVDEIRDIVIGERQGASITLVDVGSVTRGHKERLMITQVNGRESVELAVYKEGDANTVTVAGRVNDALKAFEEDAAALFRQSRMEVVFDQSTFIRDSVNEVLSTAVMGGLLAIVVLYLFLNSPKSTSIISLSIPISVVATFFLMFVSDVSLNIMSLGGIALGIGMLVDNSIVVLESIQRKREEGLGVMASANQGAGDVGRAVVASTLTTICVFVPIVFVEGIAGQLFRDQALTVTYALVASLFVALTLIPMLASIDVEWREGRVERERRRLRSGRDLPQGSARGVRWMFHTANNVGRAILKILWPIIWTFEQLTNRAYAYYPDLLRWALRHRAIVILAAVGLMGGVLLLGNRLGSELIPEISQGEFVINVEMPVGTPIEKTELAVRDIERIVREQPEIRLVYNIIGSSGEAGGAVGIERENVAEVHVALKEGIIRDKEEAVIDRLRAALRDLPSVETKFARPSLFSARTPVEVEISGYNLTALGRLADQVAGKMSQIPGLTDVRAHSEGGSPEVQIRFNRKRVAQMGTTIQAIGEVVRNQVLGEVATEFSRGDRKVDIRVRAGDDHRRRVNDLRRLNVTAPGVSMPVPLEAVADLSVAMGPAEIRRIDQQRVALVSANLEGRSLSEVVEVIEGEIRAMRVPSDFNIRVGGQDEERRRSFESMKLAIVLAIFLVYLVMASQFESLIHPFVIIFSVPFGLVGVILILLATGQTISVVVLIGLIMLTGIVVNNAIVLIDYINRLRREEGLSKLEAIERAGKVRLRPILMTTATTVLGLLPMALGVFNFRPIVSGVDQVLGDVLPSGVKAAVMGAMSIAFPVGQGAEIRAPMAITVIGGLAFSTLVTLVLIPTIYSLADRKE